MQFEQLLAYVDRTSPLYRLASGWGLLLILAFILTGGFIMKYFADKARHDALEAMKHEHGDSTQTHSS